MNKYIKILRWIWEFPQCLLGWILTKLYDVEHREIFKDIDVYSGDFPGGISLGLYIIINNRLYKYNREFAKEHEWGHTRQSLLFGWFYLPIVGLSSIIWAGAQQYIKVLNQFSPYWFWTEAWADALGGVKR